MRSAPKVTVLMTVYNGERYIPDAIESILAQTVGELELIVVDDASSDNTANILQAFSVRDPRVRILRNDSNLGPYPSANRGLEAAQSPIIARMDADDVSERERLELQLAFLERNPRCLLVGSGYRSINAMGAVQFVRQNPLEFAAAAFVTRLRMPMVHPSFCFRARRPNGAPVQYDASLSVAADFALASALSREGQIASLAAPLVQYRMHTDNISSTRYLSQQLTAHSIAREAVSKHYDPLIAFALEPLLSALYRNDSYISRDVVGAVRGMDAALANDFGLFPPTQVRERAAGILAEALLGGIGMHALRLLAPFIFHARHHLLPLAARSAQLRNWNYPFGNTRVSFPHSHPMA